MKDTNVPCCELEFWAYLIISFILISLAGITSGLALGLLSFSQVELEVFVKAGLPQDQKNAGKILPLVKNEHLLLCTLLIVKTLAMEALPVFLDPILPFWAAILMSVTLVLAFAEIIPQAVCARYGLSVGANLSVFVRFLLLVFYPIAYPISKLLDWLLGKAHSALLRRAELKTLVCLHANEAGKGGDLSHHETTIISGVLDLTQKIAKDAMTPISESFTLNINSKLDMQTMRLIMSKGHSRIPVYSGSPNNVIGLILVKSLIFCHPEDETPIKSMPIRRIPRVSEDFALYSVLNQFQKGHSHMVVVVKSKKDVKSTVNNAVCKHSKLEIVTHPSPKTTQAERKANIDDRGISSPFYQTENSDISTNDSPLYSNNKDYQSPKQNKDLNRSRKIWEKREKNISYGDLESPQNDLDEEVIGIITMEDVLEELLQEEILDETDRNVDLHNKSRSNHLATSRRLSPRSPRSISVSHLQWSTSTPDQPSPLSSYTPILRSPIPPYTVSPLIRPTLYASPGRFIMNSQGQFVGLLRNSPSISSHRGCLQKL